jgi:hypothetical protein
MLASDVANPEYVGSRNPDDALFVEFYMFDGYDKNKTIEKGKKIRLDPTPYVRIAVPGDKTSIIETPVREDHKRRWPQKWLYFQMKEGLISGDQDLPGWKLEDWDYLDAEQVRELKYQRFSIVEQIAGASDAQIQKVGMGGVALREAAKRALKDKMGAEVREEIEKKDREIASLRAADAEKEQRLKALEAYVLSQQPAPPELKNATIQEAAPEKRKPGRPKKVQEEQVNG